MAELISKSALVKAIKNSTCHWAERMWKQVVCDVISNQPTTSEAEIRAKAIDEFAERLQDKVESFQAEINGFKADVLTLDYFVEFVDEIAEELKGGAE